MTSCACVAAAAPFRFTLLFRVVLRGKTPHTTHAALPPPEGLLTLSDVRFYCTKIIASVIVCSMQQKFEYEQHT